MRSSFIPIAGLVVALVGGWTWPVGATTYYVADFGSDGNSGLTWADAKLTPKSAVDAAIAAAGDGHEVVISNGTYSLAATISISERMTVRSFANDYSTVTLDGGGTKRVLDIGSSANGTVVSGITFTNGSSSDAAGVLIGGTGHSSTVVSNCLIVGCVSTGRGGGIKMNSGSLVDSVIHGNSSASYGGGIDNISGPVNITGCLISNNVAVSGGAGIMLQNSVTNTIIRCDIVGNRGVDAVNMFQSTSNRIEHCNFIRNTKCALVTGSSPNAAWVSNCTFTANLNGGVAIGDTQFAMIVDSTFTSNSAANGGAIILGGNQTMDRCDIVHNYASSSGGGIHMVGGTVRNSLIAGNEVGSGGYGGGIRAITSPQGQVINCTIVGNKAQTGSNGSGVMSQNSGVALTNSIVLFNFDGGSVSNYYIFTANSLQFGYSCTMPAPTGTADTGSNKVVNPLFVSAGSNYGTNYVLGDLTLQADSPCKNTGLELAWMTGALDLAGKARIAQGGVDMGAYEYVQDTPLGIMVQVQ